MKKLSALFLLISATLLPATQTLAQPESGFGLFGGVARHKSEVALPGLPFSFDSSGVSIGVDWQIAIGDSFSINPIFMTSSETVSGDVTGTATHSILGVSFRFWIGELFLGPHVGAYSETVELESIFGIPASGEVTSTGSGGGIAIGWEAENGFLLMFQYDTATLEDDGGVETDLTGFRLQAGFRWK